MGLLGDRLRGRDVAVGIILSLALGLGVLFLYLYSTHATQATAILFGNVLGVSLETVWALLGLTERESMRPRRPSRGRCCSQRWRLSSPRLRVYPFGSCPCCSSLSSP